MLLNVTEGYGRLREMAEARTVTFRNIPKHSETLSNLRLILVFSLSLFFLQDLTLAEVVNKVVAVVNDEVITQQDVDELLAVLYAQYVHTYKMDELLKKMEEAKQTIVEQMIEDKLVLSRAKLIGLEVTDKEIEEKLQEVKDGFPSEEEFYNTIQTQGLTIQSLKNRYRDQILMRKAVEKEVRTKVDVLPNEITEYYQSHKEEFKQNKKVKVKNILLRAKDEIEFELARVQAEQIIERLKKGEDFEKLAEEYSQGPGASSGGDMGYIEKGQMIKELDEEVFSLNIGEISRPIKTDLGYHICKVEDIKYGGVLSLEEAYGQIYEKLFRMKFQQALKEWLEDLKKKAYISIK